MSRLRFYKGSSDYVEVQPPVGAGTSTVTLPSSTGTLTTSSEVYTLQGSSPSNRNLLYNGAMQVAQRGTSVTGITTTAYYTADRWRVNIGTLGTWTQTIEADAPTGSGLRKSVKMLCTTAKASPDAGDAVVFETRIEGQDLQRVAKGTASAQQVTLSFWVKSNVMGTYIANLIDNDNTRSVSLAYTISASATWEKKTLMFPADTTGAFDNDNNTSLIVQFFLGAGSNFTSGTLNTTWASTTNANRAVGQTNLAAATNNYWQVTGVQLEVGDTATDFEFKSYGQELRECQRYYYRITPTVANQRLGIGQASATTQGYAYVDFPVTMRARPTALEQSGTAADYWFATSVIGVQSLNGVPTFSGGTSEHGAALYGNVASGLTAGNATSLGAANTNAYLAWSAEL